MKNLLIYTGPNKKFSDEDLILARIQIDNSLDLGWKRKDLIIATDLLYLYYDFDKNEFWKRLDNSLPDNYTLKKFRYI